MHLNSQKKNTFIIILSTFLLGAIGFYTYKRVELHNEVNRYINEVTRYEAILENFYNLLEMNNEKADLTKKDVLCVIVLAHRNLEIIQSRYAESSMSRNERSRMLLELHAVDHKKIGKYILPYQTSSEYYEKMCVSE